MLIGFFKLVNIRPKHVFWFYSLSYRSSHQGCSVRKVFLEILQNSKEKTCARVSFLINFIKKKILAQVFSCEFCEISKNTFSYRAPPVTACGRCIVYLSMLFINQSCSFYNPSISSLISLWVDRSQWEINQVKNYMSLDANLIIDKNDEFGIHYFCYTASSGQRDWVNKNQKQSFANVFQKQLSF